VSEPERIPIDDPGQRYMSIRKVGDHWTTTHRSFDGSWYEIENASTPEANMTLYNERRRNDGLRLKAMLEEEDRVRAEKADGRVADVGDSSS